MERRIFISMYIVIFLSGILLLRLWDLQIVKGSEYKKIAERNRLRVIDIPAPRGVIYDRNNNALVDNIPSFDISVVKEDLPGDPETLSALGRLLGLEPNEIKERLQKAPANLSGDVKLKQGVSFEEVARIEARKIDFPWLRIDVVVRREYLYSHVASHVIGYLGRLSPKQLKEPEYSDVPREAFIGQGGVEKVYDRFLRGSAGKRIIEVDATGRIIRGVGSQPYVKGKDIRLTIDLKLQTAAEEALLGKAGAVVALDPNTGEILALASAPSFDPNLFARGINYEDWRIILYNPLNPLINRAIQSQQPPGSTFKIITALAALQEGIITKDTTFQCNGSIYLGRVFRCWKEKGHGRTDLHRAIVESCDVYFYEVGRRMGINNIAQYASYFGLGRHTGVELEGERSGILPSTQWKLRTKKQGWYEGETLNTAIGQGYLTVTPLQMARLMAAVVNGGRLYKPHLLKDEDTNGMIDEEIHIKPENLAFIKEALIGVVSEGGGTGRLAHSNIVTIGGKTGTAQVIGENYKHRDIPDRYKDHAWFVGFAPQEDPQIVVSVFVEHGGHGGSAAAPIAKKVIEAYFND